mmetsp:Transcript_4559/g.6448  ORF Transcript_4559/g.6448 Transcript_4559/m.6448 type:complete len:134 (-) Transcript_4559:169-570(-)
MTGSRCPFRAANINGVCRPFEPSPETALTSNFIEMSSSSSDIDPDAAAKCNRDMLTTFFFFCCQETDIEPGAGLNVRSIYTPDSKTILMLSIRLCFFYPYFQPVQSWSLIPTCLALEVLLPNRGRTDAKATNA